MLSIIVGKNLSIDIVGHRNADFEQIWQYERRDVGTVLFDRKVQFGNNFSATINTAGANDVEFRVEGLSQNVGGGFTPPPVPSALERKSYDAASQTWTFRYADVGNPNWILDNLVVTMSLYPL